MNNIGNYIIFIYGEDDKGDINIVEAWERKTFEEALKDVNICWGLPFEICKILINPFAKKCCIYKTVARSIAFAQL